ncbi:MAG: hypothetical protein OHK0046_31990 [Anaerolineae bacterium]
MYAENALLFPHHIIPSLRQLRGTEWQTLVENVARQPEHHEDKLAFMLLMIRLNGCLSCETDSYRAMRGCAACALQTLRRYKGSDAELLKKFQEALAEIRAFGEANPMLNIAMQPAPEVIPVASL